MTCTYEQTVNEILALFNASLLNINSLLGYSAHIEWPGIDSGTTIDNSKFWARISLQQVTSGQSTLSENVSSNGQKRFTSTGLIFVQIFAPKDNTSLPLLQKVDMLVQNCFRHSTANVILRNSRIKELNPTDGSLNHNVIADYEFDEIGG